MTRRLPPFITVPSPHPLREVLGELGDARVVDEAKTVVVANEAGLVFGSIAAATDAAITFEYVADETSEDFLLGVALRYDGDEDAFEIKGIDPEDFATPIPLLDTDNYWMAILPNSNPAAPLEMTITATAADDGVAKSGTLSIVDRFADGALTPARVLKVLTLSKTYNAP